jgi:serine/threonine protein kinase
MDAQPKDASKKLETDNRYEVMGKIGSGTYGNVFLCKDRNTGELVAIKKIYFHEQDEGYPGTALREISLLKELNHRSIIKIKEILASPTKLHIVFEYMEYDLKSKFDNHMPKDEYLTRDVVKLYMFQLLQAVTYIHSKRFLHRDIKPGNILLSGLTLKLGDFGLARALTEPARPYTEEVSTLWYRAPEVLMLSGKYGCEADVWSCACVFYELITKDGLFKGDSDIGQIHRIAEILGTPNVQEWPDYAKNKFAQKTDTVRPKRTLFEYCPDLNLDELGFDLLEKMLVYNPAHRISAAIALQHPYFKELRGLEMDEFLGTPATSPLTEVRYKAKVSVSGDTVSTIH